MPLEFDSSRFIPEQVKQCKKKLRPIGESSRRRLSLVEAPESLNRTYTINISEAVDNLESINHSVASSDAVAIHQPTSSDDSEGIDLSAAATNSSAGDESTGSNDPSHASIVDQPIFYQLLEGCSQRKGRVLVDSIGYSYGVKRTSADRTIWRCSVRNSNVNCPSTVTQDGDNFEAGLHRHIHPPRQYKRTKTVDSNLDERLILEVQSHEALYNKHSPLYKDPAVKMNLWKKIAEKIGTSDRNAKRRWTNIRDCYIRYRKMERKKSGAAANPSLKKYKYADILDFLNPHLYIRETSTNLPQVNGEEVIEEGVEIEEWEGVTGGEENATSLRLSGVPCGDATAVTAPAPPVTTSPTTTTTTSAGTPVPQIMKFRNEIDDLMMECLRRHTKRNDDDDVTSFLQAIGCTIRKFPPMLQSKVKFDIHELEKDERIVYLETENAVLHLKLAQLQSELEKERKHSSHMEALLNTAKQRDSMKFDDLKGIHQQIKEAKDDLRSLRSAVVTMPTRVTQNVKDWALAEAERLKQSLYAENMDFSLLQRKVYTLQRELTTAKDKYMTEKGRRRELHNTLVELRGNIRVHCRVRPVLEYDFNGSQTFSARNTDSPEEVVHVMDDETVNVNCNRPGHSQTNRQFEFERVYNQNESQDEVFSEVKPLLTSLLDGYNVCIMAYGQTGSGKTHTMLGGRYTQEVTPTRTILDESDEDGVVPRAARELFRLLREKPNTHTVEVSVVEVYNNEIRDLLTLNPATSRHDIFTGDDGSMEVTSLTQRAVTTAVEIVDLVRHGMTYRHEDATQVHAHSSRSHLVVTLTVTLIQSPSRRPSSRARSQSPSRSSSFREDQEIIRTKLQLVDLAGSECVGMSGVTGSALRETSHINRSLSALADVLGALAEGRSHVPYRNSRLTHLMKDSIGGDAKLLVVCCVSPTHRYLTETLQCLGFGSRARQIQRGPIKKRQGTVLPGAGDQSPVVGARGRQGQRHSIPATESSIPVPKNRTSPMIQRRSSSLEIVSSHHRSVRASSPAKPR